MENASKALVIAGAVLISILLIGVGVLIYNSAMKPIEESSDQMDAQAITMFNAKFEPYAGNKVNASSVRSLLSQIQASNATSSNQIKWGSGNEVTKLNDVEQTKTYEVILDDLEGGSDGKSGDGIIDTITIKKKK